ncbi:MAG: hypothetical protein WKG07_15455 [Hymenobacter sp.]
MSDAVRRPPHSRRPAFRVPQGPAGPARGQRCAASACTLYSTGGTQKFLEEQGAEVTAVEDLTGFPEVFGGRVKTLHPKVFGGILHRRHEAGDLAQAAEHGIPPIDLVVVDLYPFEETVASGAPEARGD